MRKSILGVLLFFAAVTLSAEETFPKPGWVEKPSPFASPDAYPGGEISFSSSQFPKSLNYYLNVSVTPSRVFPLFFEKLISANPATLEFEPNLAKSWSVSDDKRTYTFTLDERAKWSDGRAITAHDVAWTFHTVLDPKNLTGPHKISLEKFQPPKVIDDRTIQFTAKEIHWKNLISIGTFNIMPKHAYEKEDFNKINFEFPVISGPYKLDRLKEGKIAVLKRRQDWWQRDFPRNQGVGNFDRLIFKFFAERENAFTAFKTGEIDYYPIYTASIWANDAKGKDYDRNHIIKQKVYNYNPIGFQGFAMNMRRKQFSDKRVRLALAHLLDREKLNRTLAYNTYFMHQCYYHDLYNEEHECRAPKIRFDKDKAKQLLAEAGWKVNKATGLLEKDGQTFVVNFLTRAASTDKYLVGFRENLKDVGIEFNIIRKDWAAWTKDLEEYNYDMTWAAWSASLYRDPESMWLSSEADRSSGQNITGFKDPRVDELVIRQRTEFDIHKRNEIIREIDAIVSNAVPYILLWNIDYTRLLYWNKFGMPDTVLDRFNDEEAALAYWWYDEDAAADLEYAIENNETLPRRPVEVRFDDVFNQ